MFNKYMENLIDAATSKEFSEDIIKAKNEYFSKIGDIFEDDKSFENRMILFTEWYCFDRISEQYKTSPLDHFIDINTPTWTKEEIDIYTDFLKNIHSIFYIKKMKKGMVVIKDMCNAKKYTIPQDQPDLYFQKGDVFEARLIPFKEEYYFSGSFCFHPSQLYGKIKKALKSKSNNREEKREFLFLISAMSLKLERSRQISFKDIYSF